MLHITLRRFFVATLSVSGFLGIVGNAWAVLVVNDTWKDGTRTDPSAGNANFDGINGVNGTDFLIWQRGVGLAGTGTPATGDANGDTNVNAADLAIWRTQYGPSNTIVQYSENGVDVDGDGDIESAWFRGGAGTLEPVGANGPLRGVTGTSSSSWTTYFAPENAPVTLGSAGATLKITWVFKPTGVANDDTGNTGQNFRLAVVDSPAANRLSVDGSPQNNVVGETYDGYAMFMNMDQTLRRSTPFSLMKRVPGDNLGFLGASGAWTALIDDGNTNDPGYVSDTTYTYTMTITRNASDGLDITSRMEGTGLGAGNRGFLEVTTTDASPTKFTFDTFGVRPSTGAGTAAQFDTSLFKVEKLTLPVMSAVPEPGALGLAAISVLAVFRRRRR